MVSLSVQLYEEIKHGYCEIPHGTYEIDSAELKWVKRALNN